MKKEKCEHFNFSANVNVGRLTNEGGADMKYSADITIKCADCETPFHFIGLPYGFAFHEPRLSPDGCELRAPIGPGIQNFGDESKAGDVAVFIDESKKVN